MADYNQEKVVFTNIIGIDNELEIFVGKNNFDSLHTYILKKLEKSNIFELNNVPQFPSPYILACFAQNAYNEKSNKLPNNVKGWIVLATSKNEKTGYYGKVYMHPKNLHIVIAYPGTNFLNRHHVQADINIWEIKINKLISPAATFAYTVTRILKQIEDENSGIRFTLFITGHSLGGYLAQVTGFTSKFLILDSKQEYFLKCQEFEARNYHPHITVFDSPGCYEMLHNLQNKFGIRSIHETISIEELDITTYFSVPNRVNVCHKHIGRKIGIIPTFEESLKWWQGRDTFTFTKYVHVMKHFVNVLGKEIEKNEGMIKEILDWPVNSKILNEEEISNYYKYVINGKDSSYQPDINAPKFIDECDSKGGYVIRHQTSKLDMNSYPINVFTKKQKEFLKWYKILSKSLTGVKEQIFKDIEKTEHKYLFKILENYKITEKHVIDKNLQNFIPVVKAFVNLNPSILNNIDHTDDKRLICQKYTMVSRKLIHLNTNINFTSPSTQFLNFFTNDKKYFILKTSDEISCGFLWLFRSYKEGIKQEEWETIILVNKQIFDLIRILESLNEMVKQNKDINFLFFIIISKEFWTTEINQDIEINHFLRFFEEIVFKKNVKIAFITDDDMCVEKFRNISGSSVTYVFETKCFTINDLTDEGKNELFQREIFTLQCRDDNLLSLDNLLDNNGKEEIISLITGEILNALIEKKEILIGNDLKIFCEYDTINFIEPKIDNGFENLENMTLYEYFTSKPPKPLIISNMAGMGKSIFIKYLALEIKKNCPDHLVLYINLPKFQTFLKTHSKIENGIIYLRKMIESESEFGIITDFQKEIFKHMLRNNNVELFFDAFDEIACSDYEDIILYILESLKSENVNFCITTRPHKEDSLRLKFQENITSLKPWERKDQIMFLKNYWLNAFNQNYQDVNLFEQTDISRLETYCNKVIEKLFKEIKADVTGIPLICRMVAEIFESNEIKLQIEFEDAYSCFENIWQGCFEFVNSKESTEPIFPKHFNLMSLYTLFFQKKYFRFLENKLNVKLEDSAVKNHVSWTYPHIIHDLTNCSFKKIFLTNNNHLKSGFWNKQRNYKYLLEEGFGIIVSATNSMPIFIHDTVPEFFVVEFIRNQFFMNFKNQESGFIDFVVNDILLGEKRTDTRRFLNSFLSDCNYQNMDSEVKKSFAQKFISCSEQDENNFIKSEYFSPLILSAFEGNAYIVKFILEIFKEFYDSKKYKDMVETKIGTETNYYTAACYATKQNHVEVLKTLVEVGNCEMSFSNNTISLLDISITNCSHEITNWLIDYCEKIDKNVPWWAPFEERYINYIIELIKMLSVEHWRIIQRLFSKNEKYFNLNDKLFNKDAINKNVKVSLFDLAKNEDYKCPKDVKDFILTQFFPNGNNFKLSYIDFVVNDILLKAKRTGTRRSLNIFLANYNYQNMNCKVKENYAQKILVACNPNGNYLIASEYNSPLVLSAFEGHSNIVKFILEMLKEHCEDNIFKNIVETSVGDERNHFPAIIYPTYKNRMEVVKVLVEIGNCEMTFSNNSFSLLDISIIYCSHEITNWLIDYCENLNGNAPCWAPFGEKSISVIIALTSILSVEHWIIIQRLCIKNENYITVNDKLFNKGCKNKNEKISLFDLGKNKDFNCPENIKDWIEQRAQNE